MARRVFYSFRYIYDTSRVWQLRKVGEIKGQKILQPNRWEKVKAKGKPAIQKWIDDAMVGTSCQIVLIGQATAGRKWVEYEIKKAWQDHKGVFGIYVHNLKDLQGEKSQKGPNPFGRLQLGDRPFSSIVKSYDPPFTKSKNVYNHIYLNIETWVEEAIQIRKDFG